MKPIYFFIAIFFLISMHVRSQGDNCSNPKIITVCPKVNLNETTAGFTNDRTSWGSNITNGNDVVYELHVPTGSKYVLVSVTNISKPLYLQATNNNCSGTSTYATYISYDRNNMMIPLTGAGPYYIWIDHNNVTDINYSISFGDVETATFISIPNTKGNWGASTGSCPGVTLAKPAAYAEILWNGVHQNIVTYAPLGIPGVVTARIQLKNTTGVEGVKTISFKFDPGLTNFSPTVVSMPGFYNSGNWVASTSGNIITWNFMDASGTAWGDFNGVSSSCLIYEFSFNMTPLSNSPSLTNIIVKLDSDKKGSPFSGFVYTGCCAEGSNCPMNISGGSGGTGSSIGFGFNDPALPVNLISFNVASEIQNNILHWETATEHNSDKFEIQASSDGINFITIGSISSAGESNIPVSYNYVDRSNSNYPVFYYRLKQVDRDGAYAYSKIISIIRNNQLPIIYPNPVDKILNVESFSPITHAILYDQMGKQVMKTEGGIAGKNQYDLSELRSGIYYIKIEIGGTYITETIIIK
jgi:hypothetical protein